MNFNNPHFNPRGSNVKKKKSATTTNLPDNVIPLAGLGGQPPNADGKFAPNITPMEMEQMMGSITKVLEGQEFDSEEDMNAFIEEHLMGHTIDDIIAQTPKTPEDEAKEVLLDAMEAIEANDQEKAIECLNSALEIAPYSIEALSLKAHFDSKTDQELLLAFRDIVTSTEKRFGKKFMKENKGHFWAIIETRSYMRLRQTIVWELLDHHKIKEGIIECEAMLELDPNDNLGIRDYLRLFYLHNNDLGKLQQLNERYDETFLAVPAWSGVLERFLLGALEEAEDLVRSAHQYNIHAVGYMSGKKRIPNTIKGDVSPGNKTEAIDCAIHYEEVIIKHPDFQPWLIKVKLR